MAKTLDMIEKDFADALKRAEELEQIARELEVLVENNFHPCLEGILANWRGESATSFYKKGGAIALSIKETALKLKKAASTIRQTAKNVHDAEKANCEIALTRTY